MGWIKKVLMDMTTDEYGVDYDIVNVEATFSFFLGILLFVVSQVCPGWLPDYSLISYAGGVSALLAATSAAQRIKPPALPPKE